ncbi:MAG: FAD-binding protein, partial [Betaproteobacteria bacterium]|nr:FAD-binding protein [Betaproteobacteria bacterium]
MNDIIKNLSERIKHHAALGLPLVIQGGGSKAFYGGETAGDNLDVRPYCGIIDYQPKELVLTVRAGTPLTDIETQLEAAHQMLPFEPPHFGRGATIGGVVATGLSG